ncbi:MAG: hypothetical protein KC910_08050 [Candidatus Eremiobacteraeota bacterium]|nr:hypothetical protein [Candidatus Eremiobacteraeota bacterium]
MSSSVALNDAVRAYGQPSTRYRQVFNQTAEKMGHPFRWLEDDQNPNAIDPGELTVEDGFRPSEFDAELRNSLTDVLQAVEAHRLEVVAKSALHHRRIPFRAPLETLAPVERRAVEVLSERVKPILSRLEALQNDPAAVEEEAWMAQHGDFYSRQLFSRYHRDQLAGPAAHDASGSLFPFFPDKPEINAMIGPGINLDDFRQMAAALPRGADELRPTTALFRNAEGEIQTRAWQGDPAVADDHQRLAKELEAVADLEVEGQRLEPALQRQLRAWANFFRYGSRQAEKEAAQATIDAGDAPGLLRLHIGPSESYWPDNTKFPYLLQVGIRQPEMGERLKAWQGAFLPVEQSLTEVPHYQPRQLSLRGGFAEPMFQAVTAGFVETYSGREPRGNNFPNYDYGVEGSNRFILMETLPPLVEQSRQVLDRVLGRQITTQEFDSNVVLFACGHESGHLIGPQRDHLTPNGKLGAVFGPHWAEAEEPKADLTALEMVDHRFRSGEIDQATRDGILTSSLGYMLTLYPGKAAFQGPVAPHRFGYALELGCYLESGALRLEEGHLVVDYDRMAAASHDLWRRLIEFQAAGQVDEFCQFAQARIQAIPDEVDRLICGAQGADPDYYIERYL